MRCFRYDGIATFAYGWACIIICTSCDPSTTNSESFIRNLQILWNVHVMKLSLQSETVLKIFRFQPKAMLNLAVECVIPTYAISYGIFAFCAAKCRGILTSLNIAFSEKTMAMHRKFLIMLALQVCYLLSVIQSLSSCWGRVTGSTLTLLCFCLWNNFYKNLIYDSEPPPTRRALPSNWNLHCGCYWRISHGADDSCCLIQLLDTSCYSGWTYNCYDIRLLMLLVLLWRDRLFMLTELVEKPLNFNSNFCRDPSPYYS